MAPLPPSLIASPPVFPSPALEVAYTLFPVYRLVYLLCLFNNVPCTIQGFVTCDFPMGKDWSLQEWIVKEK